MDESGEQNRAGSWDDSAPAAGETSESEGALCLDFANTVDWRQGPTPEDKLGGYGDLLAWSGATGLLTAEETRLLGAEAGRQPEAAQAAFERAIALRETIYRIFTAVAGAAAVAPEDLDALNATLTTAPLGLVPQAGSLAWGWTGAAGALDRLLAPLARSAADLLTGPQVPLVRHCGGAECSWLFLDLSRNHTRRWCDMQSCGNRAKARRHYARARATRGGRVSAGVSGEAG